MLFNIVRQNHRSIIRDKNKWNVSKIFAFSLNYIHIKRVKTQSSHFISIFSILTT